MPLDLRVRLILWLAKRAGRTFRDDLTVAQMRAGYAEMNRRFGIHGERSVRVRDVTIPAEDGTPIPARFYEPPSAAAPLPLIVYFHGGGFVIGDVAAYDGFTRFLAAESGCAVLSIDYRLGPEYRYPQAQLDGLAALAWARANVGSLGTDPQRVAVAGDSAGGAIAAMLSAFAPHRPDFQLLIYPSVDARGEFPSRAKFTSGVPLTPAHISLVQRTLRSHVRRSQRAVAIAAARTGAGTHAADVPARRRLRSVGRRRSRLRGSLARGRRAGDVRPAAVVAARARQPRRRRSRRSPRAARCSPRDRRRLARTAGDGLNARSARTLAIALAGAAVALFFVRLSVSHHIYAPGARHFARLIDTVFGEQPDRHSAVIALRKIYSIGAFALLGVFVALVRARGRHRVRDAAIAIGVVSTIIEVVQKASGSPESLRSNLFDIGCGAVGGALGALLVRGNQSGPGDRSGRL